MRETWGRDSQIKLHMLNFGVDHFEEQFRNWCTNPAVCKVHFELASNETDVPSDVMSSKLWNLDGHIWAMRQALKDPSCQWVLVGQDMLYLHMDHLRAYLETLDFRKSLVLGSKLRSHVSEEMVSPWGFLLSRGATQRLVDGWDLSLRSEILNSKFCSQLGGMADFGFSLALKHMKPSADFVDTRNDKGEDRFYLWPPSRMDRGDWWDSWYEGRRIDKPKATLSSQAFLFFFAGPREIRTLGSFFDHGGPLGSFLDAPAHKTERTLYKETTWKMLDKVKQGSFS
jgi:hypothetical protein